MTSSHWSPRSASAGRHAWVLIAILSAIVAGCAAESDAAPSTEGGATATDDATADAGAGETEAAASAGSSDVPVDMCDVVGPDDLEAILTAAASATYQDDVVVGDATPLTAGECSFAVEVAGVGSARVQLRVGNDFTFGHYRDTEDVTDVAGLGDEAYEFHGVAGPELHVRTGETWLGVRVGSYDDRFGLTEESHAEVATMALERLAGS